MLISQDSQRVNKQHFTSDQGDFVGYRKHNRKQTHNNMGSVIKSLAGPFSSTKASELS